VSKTMPEKDIIGAWCCFLRAHAENVDRITTEHAATKSGWITAAESSDWIGRVVSRGGCLIPEHSLFCW
jgi:hypothetical protein